MRKRGFLHLGTVMFTVIVDFSHAVNQLDGLQKRQIPFAAKNAINKLAKEVISAEQDEMRTVFDSPRAWTLNSLFVRQYADKHDLTAIVDFKDDVQNRSASKYLAAQMDGGNRRTKAIETVFVKHGLMPAGHHIVPSSVELDRNGNITLSTFRSMIAGVTAGTHFVLHESTGKLPAGLYERIGSRDISALIVYVPDVYYQKLFHYFETAEQTVHDKQQAIFADALNHALATAR